MIYIANDHAGFDLAIKIVEYLKNKNIKHEHVGALEYVKTDNYVEHTLRANKLVVENEGAMGIYLCGTGIGTSIAANRNKKIRAALCHSVEFAYLARFHNNANVLVLPGRYLTDEQAYEIIDKFLQTPFEGGRHIERVEMLGK